MRRTQYTLPLCNRSAHVFCSLLIDRDRVDYPTAARSFHLKAAANCFIICFHVDKGTLFNRIIILARSVKIALQSEKSQGLFVPVEVSVK